jgi:hypothetical protein
MQHGTESDHISNKHQDRPGVLLVIEVRMQLWALGCTGAESDWPWFLTYGTYDMATCKTDTSGCEFVWQLQRFSVQTILPPPGFKN